MNTPDTLYESHARPELLPFLPEQSRSFLDVGCARGGFGASIRRRFGVGVRLVGIEPVEAQAADARAHYDEVVVGLYPDAVSEWVERYDCVVLADVLEHMLDPWAALESMKSLLTEEGRIVASIPNIQFLPMWLKVLRGRWDYADSGILDRTHIRFFTRKTMIEMFSNAGYETEQVQGIKFMEGGRKAKLLRPLRRLIGDAAWLQYVIVARPLRGQ